MAIAGDNGDHLARPEPARTGPIRTGLADPGTPPLGADPTDPATADPANCAPGQVHTVIADAVRIGYDVINENLRQGRAAANAHSAGQYRLEHVSDDLAQLGSRLVQLSRDLGTTWFDLVGAVLADPAIQAAVTHRDPGRRAPPAPRPEPVGPQGPVPLTCVFRGNARASADPVILTQPEAPSLLTMAALRPTEGDAPPITRISFAAATTGGPGVVAIITVPDDQPPGTYHGIVADAATHTALGAVTVRVAG